MVEVWQVNLGPEDLPRFRVRKGSPVTPGMPTKNAYFTVNPYTKRITSRAVIMKSLRSEIAAAHGRQNGGALPVYTGSVELRLLQFAPKIRRTGAAAGLPLLDSDACLAAVRDAIEALGIVEDDAQITRNVSESVYRKGEPGLLIELRTL